MARRSLPAFALLVLLGLSLPSFGAQIPFFSSPIATPGKTSPSIEIDVGQWNLSVGPSTESASHLVFDTVASLLQHWPNTRYRNGHNIVPGIVPVGTLLYHDRPWQGTPDKPDWVATDPEHARWFCASFESSPRCWHMSFVATRPLKILYFDGSSAAKMQGGSMDTQDYVAWNASRPDWIWNEEGRIADLCDWGKSYRLDGFYRMEMDFEIMLCDFASGIQLVSSVQLDPLHTFPDPTGSGEILPDLGLLRMNYQVIQAGSWHNFYPGEARLKLDLTRLISFYDTDTFPSLVQARSGVDRLQHRISGISEKDVQVFHERLDEVLRDFGNPQDVHLVQDSGSRSGVDWRTLYQVIVDRYADRLEMLQYILNSTDPTAENYSQNNTRTVENAMYRLQLILTTYALRTARPPTVDTGVDEDLSWASPVYQYCATTHTSALYPVKSSFTRSEHLLLSALEATNREICRVLVRLWGEGMQAGIDPGLPFQPKEGDDDSGSGESWSPMLNRWRDEVNGLMGWLGWSLWLKCRPECGIEEICYLPTWPWFKRPHPSISNESFEGNFGGADHDNDPDRDWKNPLPRCIRHVEPFDWRYVKILDYV
ncbi:hypothetical protein BDN72DRAFT_840485 [Pluteus cervinus]|uniref:Uncharacterized protein n=1 Tax=Pluteus cervinus TaxID=181527 RepID=A0ACD3AVA3_9AGAR|nr:hypothetical protein BDN72DRAFT_840485 [Pluteus cervinus]